MARASPIVTIHTSSRVALAVHLGGTPQHRIDNRRHRFSRLWRLLAIRGRSVVDVLAPAPRAAGWECGLCLVRRFNVADGCGADLHGLVGTHQPWTDRQLDGGRPGPGALGRRPQPLLLLEPRGQLRYLGLTALDGERPMGRTGES